MGTPVIHDTGGARGGTPPVIHNTGALGCIPVIHNTGAGGLAYYFRYLVRVLFLSHKFKTQRLQKQKQKQTPPFIMARGSGLLSGSKAVKAVLFFGVANGAVVSYGLTSSDCMGIPPPAAPAHRRPRPAPSLGPAHARSG